MPAPLPPQPVRNPPPARRMPPEPVPPAPPQTQIDNGAIARPAGVPDTHHLMWVDHNIDPKTGRSLAMDLHQFYGPQGHVIPHGFAPLHARISGNNSEESQLPVPPQIKVPPFGTGG